jgi:hypothetical protein
MTFWCRSTLVDHASGKAKNLITPIDTLELVRENPLGLYGNWRYDELAYRFLTGFENIPLLGTERLLRFIRVCIDLCTLSMANLGLAK